MNKIFLTFVLLISSHSASALDVKKIIGQIGAPFPSERQVSPPDYSFETFVNFQRAYPFKNSVDKKMCGAMKKPDDIQKCKIQTESFLAQYWHGGSSIDAMNFTVGLFSALCTTAESYYDEKNCFQKMSQDVFDEICSQPRAVNSDYSQKFNSNVSISHYDQIRYEEILPSIRRCDNFNQMLSLGADTLERTIMLKGIYSLRAIYYPLFQKFADGK